jgi:hypothetical protein
MKMFVNIFVAITVSKAFSDICYIHTSKRHTHEIALACKSCLSVVKLKYIGKLIHDFKIIVFLKVIILQIRIWRELMLRAICYD